MNSASQLSTTSKQSLIAWRKASHSWEIRDLARRKQPALDIPWGEIWFMSNLCSLKREVSITRRAHICGLMSNHLNFRLERIIALDPARPLIRPGNQNRLDTGDARAVQVIHTNAGYYGEAGRVGHIDFCVNGGRRLVNISSSDYQFLTDRYLQATLLLKHDQRQSVLSHLVCLLSGCIRIWQRGNHSWAVPPKMPVGCQSPVDDIKNSTTSEEPLWLRSKLRNSNGPVNTENVIWIRFDWQLTHKTHFLSDILARAARFVWKVLRRNRRSVRKGRTKLAINVAV